MAQWWEIAASVVGGGVGTQLINWKINNRKQDQSEFVTLVAEYKQMVDDYKIEVKELRSQVSEIKIMLQKRDEELKARDLRITELEHQLIIFESSHADVPLPIWLKDVSGRMLFVNQEYVDKILHPIGKTATDYVGNYDRDIWPEQVALAFGKNDSEVQRKKKSIEFTETWHGPYGITYQGRLIKYPRFLGKTIIGIGGIIVDIKIIKNAED